jgi:foldase protein PrsA
MLKKLLKKAALISISAIMCINSYAVSAASTDAGNVVAQVNSKSIDTNKYKTEFLTILLQYEASNGQPLWANTKTINDIQDAAFQNMLNNQIQLDKADKMGIKFEASQQSVLDSVYKNAISQYTQYLGTEFTNALAKVKITSEQFNTGLKNLIKEQLTINTLKQKIIANYKLPTFTKKEIENEYIKENENVTGEHILISFDKHKDADAKKIATDVLAKIKKGEKFSDLAAKYSEDTGSASNGGSLGQFKRGQMIKSFEDSAFSLKIGEVSGLVKSEYGYHIIMVESHMIPDVSKMTDSINKQMIANLKTISQNNYYSSQLTKWQKEAKINKYNYKFEIK